MAATSSDKVLIGMAGLALVGSAVVFGMLASRKASAPPPDVAPVEFAAPPYVPMVSEPAPVKTVTWNAPDPQSRGREWIYDTFTPPEIFYNARTKQFTVRPPSSLAEGADEPFGIELLSVRPEPFRLQLIGYVGDEGDWRGTFENLLTGEVFLAGAGRRMPNLALSIKGFEVRSRPVALADSMTTQQRIATAVIHDDRAQQDVTLTHRERKFTGTVTALIAVAGEKGAREVRPGDTFKTGQATFRIERVQLAPPAIEITKAGPPQTRPDRRTLSPREPDEAPEAEDGR